ncbi:MAG: hypothetical protein M3346_02860 [Actinomycetota bacterium]|nr:hypothetical protein [Actinomycetota bacterium]
MSVSLEAIHDQLSSGVEQLVSSDEWAAMLKVAARFHDYQRDDAKSKGQVSRERIFDGLLKRLDDQDAS